MLYVYGLSNFFPALSLVRQLGVSGQQDQFGYRQLKPKDRQLLRQRSNS